MDDQAAPALEILTRLFEAQQDIAIRYSRIITQYQDLEADVRAIFGRIIEESTAAALELKKFLARLSPGSDVSAGTIQPDIIALNGGKKEILATCLTDLETLQTAYSIALSWKGTERIAGKFPFDHLQRLKLLHDHIRLTVEAQ